MNRNPSTFSSRPYIDEDDLRQMQALLMQARVQTDDWRYPHLGDLNFWFFMLAIHLDPHKHIRLWHDAGQLIGYAILNEDPNFDCQFLPQYAWQGLEDQALDWAEGLVRELRQENPATWGGPCVCGARQDDADRIAFLERRGFQPGGQFSEVNMLRMLDEPVPAPSVPLGCQVRSMGDAHGDELTQRAGAQREVWYPWTVGEVRDEDYAYLMRLPGYLRELDVVAVTPEGKIASYVNGWIDPVNHIGDLGPLGALPAYRRQGLTRAAILECLRRMQSMGMDRVSVSTTITNTPARNLYESIGFRIANEYHEYLQSKRGYHIVLIRS